MPSVLDLSNELLDHIIRIVPPFDLLSLALSKKCFYALAEKALKQHLAFQKEYSVLSFCIYDYDGSLPSSSEESDEVKDPLLFLGRIIQDPFIALYPRTVCIGPYIDGEENDGDYDHDEIVSRREVVIQNYSAELKTLFEKCGAIPVEEKSKMIDNIGHEYYQSANIALLITLLPNLTHIASQSWFWGDVSETIRKTVHRVAQSNHDPQSPFHNMALTKLAHFSMHHTERKNGEDVNAYGPFAMLPSMRTLSGDFVDGANSTFYGADFNWPSEPQTVSSYVTEINFTSSCISTGDFHWLLCRILALKRFTYTYYQSQVVDAYYDPAGYVESLREYAATSLQVLNVSSDNPEIVAIDCDGREYQGVGSLKMFTSLEEVSLEDTMFQIPDFELSEGSDDESLSGSDNESFSGSDNEFLSGSDNEFLEGSESDAHEEPSQTTQRIVDILPANVKFLSLLQTKDEENMQKLFEGVVELKAQKLPKLEMVDFRPINPLKENINPLNENTRKALEGAGITLTTSKLSGWMAEITRGYFKHHKQ